MPPRIVTSPMSPIEFAGADRDSGIAKSVTVMRSSFTHVELVTLTVGTCDELASSSHVSEALSRQRMRVDGWLRTRKW